MSKYLVTDTELTSVADAIREKGGTSDPLEFPDEFVSAIEDIPTGGGGADESKPVKFIDYDGTVVYSYTPEEFAALSAMPENPTHEGLIAQGWNWTLADAQEYVAKYGRQVIGQMYITDDGKTRLYITIPEGRQSPTLKLRQSTSNRVVINWGDGYEETAPETTTPDITHTYADPGDYIITLHVTSETPTYNLGRPNTCLFGKVWGGTDTCSVYPYILNRVEMGNYCSLQNGAFKECINLQSITIPESANVGTNTFNTCPSLKCFVYNTTTTALAGNMFDNAKKLEYISIPKECTNGNNNVAAVLDSLKELCIPESKYILNANSFIKECASLKHLVIPDNAETVGNYFGYRCHNLEKVILPPKLSIYGQYTFAECSGLINIIIPELVTEIGANSFYRCFGLKEIHFRSNEPPVLKSNSVFYQLSSDCIIYVPYSEDHSILAAYTSATNYPSSSTYTYTEETV